MEKPMKIPAVLGVGNALVDIITVLENDNLLTEYGLPRGSMTLVDAGLSKKLFDATQHLKREMTTGGSAANAMHALASLGGNCGYLGKTGGDRLGQVFREEFERKKIRTHLFTGEKETGRVMGLVSPDSERTMATYLGAAADLKPQELYQGLFKDYAYLFIEGYLVQDHVLIEKAIDLAKAEGLKISIDLSSFNVVEANLDFLKRIVRDKVDIVFANEEEALAFTGKNPEEALDEIAGVCEIAVVKAGREGSFIRRGKKKVKIGIIPALAVDTTGAGDAYAAGIFYGLTHGFGIEKCGRIAALVSGKVVEVMGAKLPDAAWPFILDEIGKMPD